MTEKQARFADEYISSAGNASEAARRAGYSRRGANVQGANLLRRADVRETIDARLDELKSEKIADEKEILEYLTSVLRGNECDDVVTNSGKMFTLRVSAANRLKAAEMLAKIFGMFKRSDDETSKIDGAALLATTLEKVWQDAENSG